MAIDEVIELEEHQHETFSEMVARGLGMERWVATFFAFLGGGVELARSGSWERVQEAAFRFGFLATGGGIGIYLFGLVSGLY